MTDRTVWGYLSDGRPMELADTAEAIQPEEIDRLLCGPLIEAIIATGRCPLRRDELGRLDVETLELLVDRFNG